jgi:hypothetical protein
MQNWQNKIKMTVLNKKIYNLKLLLSRTSKMMSSQNVTIPLASCAKLNEETYLPKEISTIDEEDEESSLDSWNESNASENSGELIENPNDNNNNKTEQDDLEKSNSSELNKMSLSDDDKNNNDDDDEIVRFKNCLVSFMYSSEDLFVQMEDFEEKITQIQPDVDDCLDPYILSESNLCIAQYKEVINHIFK